MTRRPSFPSLHTFRGLSVSKVALYRTAVLGKFLLRHGQLVGRIRRDLRPLRSLENKFADRDALLVAGGGSVKLLELDEVRRRQADGMHVFAMNMYHLSDMARLITPDYYVLADPEFFPRRGMAMVPTCKGAWDYIRENEIVPVVPVGAEVPAEVRESAIYFNDIGLQGWSRNINPTKPRGFSGMVAHDSLAVALFFGYRKIFVAGIDNDLFRNLYRDDEGAFRHRPGTHHYSMSWTSDIVGARRTGNLYVGGMAAYFENVGRLFGDLQLFADERIFHVDRHSLVDAFRPLLEEDQGLARKRSASD